MSALMLSLVISLKWTNHISSFLEMYIPNSPFPRAIVSQNWVIAYENILILSEKETQMVLYLKQMKYASWNAKFHLQRKAAWCFTLMHLFFFFFFCFGQKRLPWAIFFPKYFFFLIRFSALYGFHMKMILILKLKSIFSCLSMCMEIIAWKA